MSQIKDRMVAKLLTRYPSLFERWARKSEFIEFTDTPWTQFDADVSDCRLALITTGGVHLKEMGTIGSVNDRHFSFMGHIMHHHIDTLMNETAPRVAEMLKRDAVDIVILTPA